MTEMTAEAKEARTATLNAQAEAAAAAALNPKAPLPKDHVRVRITKAGNGKVSTGAPPKRTLRGETEVFEGEQFDQRFAHNETPILPREIAVQLEERHYAEIID